MKTRPWPIVILAIIHVLGPIGNIFLSARLQHMSPYAFVIGYTRTQSFWHLVDFFLVFPLAGAAIYACKKWSYPFFLAVALYTVYSNYLIWRIAPQVYPLGLFVATTILDIVFVGYFLNSAVRAMYMNPRLRWWESKPRYLVQASCSVTLEDSAEHPEPFESKLTDISENGIFLLAPKGDIQPKQSLRVKFTILGTEYETRARVIYCRDEGCGVFFLHEKQTKKKILGLCRVLKLQGTPIRGAVNLKEDFKNWILTLFRTGEGLIPK